MSRNKPPDIIVGMNVAETGQPEPIEGAWPQYLEWSWDRKTASISLANYPFDMTAESEKKEPVRVKLFYRCQDMSFRLRVGYWDDDETPG